MKADSAQISTLNNAQQSAVTDTEGPMLIIAGAGTGKTRVITSRILHLLLEKSVPSENVLALTFTEKAANEMVERIDAAMPLSYEEVTIKTFHSLCDQILKERGLEIGIDSSYKILSQPEQWIFFKKHLFEFELDYYRPLGNPNKFIYTLLNHFSRLQDEDISADRYLEYAQNLKSDEAEQKLELAKVYKKYQELKIAKNVLDFGDLQTYALRLFKKRPSVLKYYQERFKYVMVDEFQDTNFAQNKLVMMLAAAHSNIAVVGDDDQSIYKWRGASLSNILGFKKVFPATKEVVLTSNYRSTQNILDLSYDVIQSNNPQRLESKEQIDKKLIAENGEGEKIRVWHFSSYLNEARKIVQRIEELRNDNNSYRDFAILVRTNQLTNPYIEALKEAGIPFTVRDTKGLLRFEEIKDLHALLRFLIKPHDDAAFFRLLSLPIFDVPMTFILELVAKAKKNDYSPLFFYLKDLLSSDDQKSLPGMSEYTSPLKVPYGIFKDLLEFTRKNSVARTFGEFLDKSGYYKQLTAVESAENEERIQHIAQFIEIARNFESTENENSLRDFLEYLESLDEANGALALEADADSNSVKILTAHSAKGLEFDYVFLPSLVANRFPSINKRDPIEIPKELINEDLEGGDMHLNEERRLFYTACTRAKKELYLSYSDFYEGNRKWKMSPFLAEAISSGKTEEKDFSGETVSEDSLERRQAGIKQGDSDFEKKLADAKTVNVNRLSYSQIDTFKTCPLKYKFRYLFGIPSPSAHAANFGSSVHNTVNAFYEDVKKGTQPSLELLEDLYEKHWISVGYDNKAHEQARKAMGKEMMQLFFENESKDEFAVPAFLEKAFNLKIGGVLFTGRIDRIDKKDDGTYEVIDYKTGKSKRDANLDKDLQLSLYALACKEIFKIPVPKLTLYFLEDGQKNSTQRTDEDLEELKLVLKESVDEIKSSAFCATPGFPCSYCEYKIMCNKAK
ncbi:ATP-dependent helicase [Pseudomonadota bacterium]